MGGSLFKDLGAQRVTTQTYESKYVPELTALLKPLGIRFDFVQYYRNKEDHGNINILVNKATVIKEAEGVATATVSLNPNRKEVIIQHLKANGYTVRINSDVVSFLYDGCLQVDLVFTKPSCYEYSKAYYSWNDLGGLIGRMTRGIGLKHGCNGLYYVHYNEDKTRKLGEYLLTTDHDKTLEILGLDRNVFAQGFDSLEDIFEYVTSSKYFGVRAFVLEDLPCKDRHRDQKRNTFIKFDEFCEQNRERLPQRAEWLPEDKERFVVSLFPTVQEKISDALEKEEKRVALAAKFNGHIIMNMFDDLKSNPKELGAFIRQFKEEYSDEELLHLTPEAIKSLLTSFYTKLKGA